VLDLLLQYRWPGNVRELRTSIEHAVVMCRGERLMPRDLPAAVRSGAAAAGPRELSTPARPGPATLSVEEAEKDLITRALKESGSNRTEAARKLGISRRTLQRKLHLFNLEHL
jgi:two-component system response regulator HydG